jgi:signal transduction histidine kinase
MQGYSSEGQESSGAVAQTAATLRDGLLQDLIAISIMLKDVSRSMSPGDEPESLLQRAAVTLEDDLAELRLLIRSLEDADACQTPRSQP